MKNVFLFGYYGFQNTGDEAILESIIKQFKKALPDIKLSILTYKAKETSQNYGVHAISRNQYRDILKAIRESDVVISGGGSILQDVTSSRSLIYYLAIIFLAKRMGKKVMFYGNGFGPITRMINKFLVKYIINQVDVITVRDYQSKEVMQALGVKKNINVTADVTFVMEPASEEEVKAIYERLKIDDNKKVIGISIRQWKGQENYKKIIASTGDYLMKRNFEVLFIPMQYPEDLKITEEVANMMEKKPKIVYEKYLPCKTLAIISKLYMLIGMRLHSLIFAAISGIPMVGLEYEPKILNFLKLANQKSGGKVEALDQIHLWTTIDQVLESRDKIAIELNKTREQLKKKAKENMETFIQFVKEEKENEESS